MELTIEQALSDQWAMFYHPQWPVEDLQPVCTLEQSIHQINHQLRRSRDLSTWSSGFQNEIARLLRANWIYQRLAVEPIRKPVLVHEHHDQLVVDCGDTRLMSLKLLSNAGTVAVVVTVPKHRSDCYANWQPIRSNQDLRQATGFGPDAVILLRAAPADYAVEWLEIGDQTTAHHLHNVDQRVDMMQTYINEQAAGFEFSNNWARSGIVWDNYVR